MKGQKFFIDALNGIPDDIEKQVEWSMLVSDKIAGILERRNLTQKDFAKSIGRSEAEVSRWLGGTHNFTLSTLAKISSSLGEDVIRVEK